MRKTYLLAVLLITLTFPLKALAQDPYMAEIRMFAGNFAPRNWAFCDGSILPIASNQALFSLLGTTYGGNGITTFALPDLRGRVPIHTGNSQGPGLSPYALGQIGGNESVQLAVANLPAHSHAIAASTSAGTTSSPAGAYPANTGSLDKEYTNTPNTLMAPMGNAGSNMPLSIMQPYTGVNFIICTAGIYPSRP